MSQADGFFAIDQRVWPAVCGLGLNAAVAYLVLARGTDRANRITTWSVQAIEQNTGISRRHARLALDKLIEQKLVRLAVPGVKPRHELMPAHEVPQQRAYRKPLAPAQAALLDRIETGGPLSRSDRRGVLGRLRDAGWVSQVDGVWVTNRPRPEFVWLPNTLVSGAAGELSPIERVRQAQDVMTLRLLVDLYSAHHLRDDGGIDRQMLWETYERVQVGQRGQFVVWGFKRVTQHVNFRGVVAVHRRETLTKEEKAAGENSAVDFFPRLGTLEALGLLEYVPHLLESVDEGAQTLHTMPAWWRASVASDVEQSVTSAARSAANALITEAQAAWAHEQGLHLVVPVERHMNKIALVGVARLRYRPLTKVTRMWHANTHESTARYTAKYQQIQEDTVKSHDAASRIFKAASR